MEKNNFRKIATITLFESAVQWYCFLLYGTAAGTVFNKVFFSQTGNGTTAVSYTHLDVYKRQQERVFDMKINIKEFTGKCSCGRDHQLVVDDVILEEGALKKLPEILNKEPYDQYKHLVMVCDDNTYEAAGKEVERLLGGIPVIKLDPENLHANEIGVAKVKEQLDLIKEVDCMIAVGSGTIHDLTRYNAYERKIPFISVPTAASVDGYVSTVAAMSWYGFKKSMIAESPIDVYKRQGIDSDWCR